MAHRPAPQANLFGGLRVPPAPTATAPPATPPAARRSLRAVVLRTASRTSVPHGAVRGPALDLSLIHI
ncbi:hypothetical protein, partial [Myceligenerans indicum]|uniref:hypothetical protein n=1 Tax=Myceligenerans indicum TaxID=2593663 RepID=UPI001A920F64